MSRRFISFCAGVCVVLFVAVAHAQLPQVDSGVAYLASSQSVDGTWGNGSSMVDGTAATVTALDTLKLLNESAGMPYSTGISWLQGQSPQSVAYTAERIRALVLGADSLDSLLSALDQLKGAWGGGEGYETDILDTAIVLQALRTANYDDATITNKALAYLTANQNSDGGWGFCQGDESNIYMTAVVSAALQQFPQVTSIATAVNKASAYLVNHQNGDGGFGASESTPYETALAYSALAAVSSNSPALTAAINYLTVTQSANGSWQEDPYSTALALKALYYSENKPAPPPAPPAGGTITGTAVDAVTKARVPGVAISLTGNSLVNTTSDSSGNFTLSDVPAATQSLSFSVSGYAAKIVSTNVTVGGTASLGDVALLSSYSTGTIAGTITDVSGKPVQNAAITVTGSWSGSTVTGADGSYSFSYVTPGEVTVAATKSGFESVSGAGTVYARTTLYFSPRLNSSPSQVTTGTLVGRVIGITWWEGPISPIDGEPGVRITLSDGTYTEPDANGYFIIQGIAPNTYQTTVGKDGFATKTFRVVITPGTTTDLGTIGLETTISEMTLTGKVTDALTGVPIPGAELITSDGNLTGRTDFAGVYAIADIAHPSVFTIRVTAPGYVGKSFIIGSSAWLETMDFALMPQVTNGSLAGVVADASTGQPIPGATLTLASNPSVSAVTDSTGAFSFATLPKGVQKIAVASAGYVTRTLTTPIVAGAANKVGKILLSVNELGASIQGTAWDAVAKAPFADVAIQTSGAAVLQTTTGADGDYQLDNATPGEVTVEATSVAKTGYYPARFTGTLEPGGILVFNPALTTLKPAVVDLSVQTDKESYRKGDTVGFSVVLRNTESAAHSASLRVKISDPAGSTIFESGADTELAGDGVLAQYFSAALPVMVQGGEYTIFAELFDANGANIGLTRQTFGVATSRITVTPTLPPAFVVGTNQVSFDLANIGELPVATCTFEVTLKDPDGAAVSSASQTFALGLGEKSQLNIALSVPPLKFGTYTLTYTQSDETVIGRPKETPLPNSVGITALYDSNSHRVRNTAGLTLVISNTGRFNLDSDGAGLPVSVSVPDAAYAETKSLVPAPRVGNVLGSTLFYSFVIPETMTAAQHGTRITVTLPSGSATAQTVQLAIPESSLSLSLLQSAYSAGDTIRPTMPNDGGVDTTAQYRLSLYDARSALIAETTGSATVTAGAFLPLEVAIPSGATDGSYRLEMNCKDMDTGKEQMINTALTVNGVKASLQVQTNKQNYLLTENVNALATIANSGTPLQNGNLHLQVTTGAGIQVAKTWTTQADFQTGARAGVDTYGVNDWVIPNDDFSGTSIDTSKWMQSGNATIKSNALYIDTTQSTSGAAARSAWLLEGDFDVQVDFDANNSSDWVGAQMGVGVGSSWMSIGNYKAPGYGSQISINNVQMAYVTGGSSAISGRFRVTRSGSTMSSYYWGGTSWVALSTYTAQELSGPASVALNIYRAAGLSGATAQFDNFKVNSGRIKTANQTVDSVRLMPLSDNFDRGSLNTDRWGTWTNNGTVSVVNGAIELKNPDGVAAGQYADAGHRGAWIEGDFDIQVDFDNVSSSTSGYIYAIRAHFMGGEGIKTAYHWLINNTYNAVYRDPTGQYDIALGSSPPADKRGRLRLKRVGSTITWFYWNITLDRWEWNGNTAGISMTAPTSPVMLVLEGNKYLSNTVGNAVRFDNVLVSQRYVKSGKLTLKYDSGRSGAWNKLSYTADTPSGTSLKFRTRTSETSADLANAIWSDFFTGNDSIIPSPVGRWIEVEATLATTDANVTPILRDVTVSQGFPPGSVLWQADVPANLAQGAVLDQINAVGALGFTGKFYLQGALTSSTGQTVASAEYPFYVEQGNFLLFLAPDKKVYRPGEPVTVAGEVKNQGTVDASSLSLTLASKPVGGVAQVVANKSFTLAAGASFPFTASLIAGADGVVDLTGTVTQNGVTLADMVDQYEVASPMVTATLTAPDTADNAPFALNLALVNGGKTDASVAVSTSFGSATETVVVPAGRSVYRQYQEQITADATYTVTLTGDAHLTLSKSVVFVAPPPIVTAAGINAKVVTDKISYSANERAALTSFITAGTAVENLSALITVTNDQGQGIYTAETPLAIINQGQTVTLSNYWDIGTVAPGTYLVGLQVADGTGTVLTKAVRNLTVISSASPKALLKGQLTLDRQSLLTGEPVTVSYNITNVGNTDLSGVALSVRTINLAGQTVYCTITDQAALDMGGSHANSGRIDTQGFSARDYLVILSAAIGGVEETLAGSYFRVEGAPSTPAISAPPVGSDVETVTPVLAVSNAADPNADRLSYEFEVYADRGMTTLVASGTVSETSGTTSWTLPVQLVENRTYFWRARAYDGRLYGLWMDIASFRVNTVNDPPQAPTVSGPADGSEVAQLKPALAVNNASDPDSAELTYNFAIALDPEFTQVVASVTGIVGGEGTTSWMVPDNLQENTSYYWRAQADDWFIEGPWSTTATFFVNTANDAPTAPVVVAPAGGETVASLATDVVVRNGQDPDSPHLSYYFEADTTPSFDSENVIRSGSVVQGENTTSWAVTGLKDNARYFVRVKASDGAADSPWSTVSEFAVNTVNDAPTSPTLANPSNGSGVAVLNPALSVHNATDLDHDVLSYQFAVYADPAMTQLVAGTESVAETSEITSWEVPQPLTENMTYYWRSRAFDGAVYSDWMPGAAFTVNTANDSPSAPKPFSPAENSSVETATPILQVINAVDPDSNALSYDFEIYSGGGLVAAGTQVPGDASGMTSWAPPTALADNSVYQWRARAFDGESYGPWTALASFTVHLPTTSINAAIDFDPDTLNRQSNGTWVVVYIELPSGYRASDIDVSSIRLEGSVPAEARPYSIGDHDKDGNLDLMVKFRRSDVINLLSAGEKVTVHLTGKVGEVQFEGVDIIRVIK